VYDWTVKVDRKVSRHNSSRDVVRCKIIIAKLFFFKQCNTHLITVIAESYCFFQLTNIFNCIVYDWTVQSWSKGHLTRPLTGRCQVTVDRRVRLTWPRTRYCYMSMSCQKGFFKQCNKHLILSRLPLLVLVLKVAGLMSRFRLWPTFPISCRIYVTGCRLHAF